MVAAWKSKEIEELTKKIKKSRVIGLVDICGIPSRQFQMMRKSLSGKAEVRVSRVSLIKRSFDKAGIKGLDAHIEGSMGLVLTDLNPFKLNRILEDGRISAPAKGGSIAPRDIIVPEGETSLPPGPIIGDLQKVGVKAQIRDGKITVTENSKVVEEGSRISSDLAMVLTRLGIEPMEIGLKLNSAYEAGLIYTSDILSIDDTKTIGDIQKAYVNALNLSLNAGIYNPETITHLLRHGFGKALNLAINAEVFNKETIKFLLRKAHGNMLCIASRVPDALDEELKETASSTPVNEEKDSEEDAASGLASLFG